jgi:transcriptional regulator with XRE-family HTH domain
MRGTHAQEARIPSRKPERKPDQLDRAFAKRLSLAMAFRDVRPSDLADRAPVHRTTVSMWRRGTRPNPPTMARLAHLLDVPMEWLAEGKGPSPLGEGKALKAVVRFTPSGGPSGRASNTTEEAEGDDPEGAGWLWEDPREAEDSFRSYIRGVERSVRGLVIDPVAVEKHLKELRLVVVDMFRSGARAAGKPVPPFVQVVENEIIAGTFR